MLIKSMTASWAGHESMVGFPILPKTLPTKSSYKLGGQHHVTKTKCFRTVRWMRVIRRVGLDQSTGKHLWKWEDAYWLD